jgi:hypothetical protein
MSQKINWNRVKQSKNIFKNGTFNYKDEAKYNQNIDNYWKKKLKGKYKSFFDNWEKTKNYL